MFYFAWNYGRSCGKIATTLGLVACFFASNNQGFFLFFRTVSLIPVKKGGAKELKDIFHRGDRFSDKSQQGRFEQDGYFQLGLDRLH